MLKKHSLVVAMMNRDTTTAFLLRDYFDLPRHTTLMSCLLHKQLGQADLVLALLRLRDRRPRNHRVLGAYIELLVGHPITVAPTCLLRYATNTSHPRVVRSRDERKITFVLGTNPRAPATAAHLRWCEFRVGRSLGQLYVRGVTKRDVRKAVRKGWIKVEEVA
jgi:hypothetical protein